MVSGQQSAKRVPRVDNPKLVLGVDVRVYPVHVFSPELDFRLQQMVKVADVTISVALF